ncbi:hypothetical protein LMW91_002623 [Escherichia coli]|nr:hypothetical protein [Escherichia coli]EBN0651397.1 hypothetical protein [Salmonella enterica]EBN9190814.1 hypothetical protein [Salmonella enterica subsp. enterica serovar Roodepoort]ECC3316145.1 hypothetical protein [Salmonella enterica subsp. enterica]EEA8716992.1 hypothetical protein [Salmonella enterica subsp. enterica serovar Lexington]EEZ9839599.1 hypothetical protein [Escherichia coli O25]EJD6640503.1 hypothetical protein [Citrobacter freundii]MBE8621302.1 hypothetical protein [Sa
MSWNWHKNSIKKPARRRVTDQMSGFEG